MLGGVVDLAAGLLICGRFPLLQQILQLTGLHMIEAVDARAGHAARHSAAGLTCAAVGDVSAGETLHNALALCDAELCQWDVHRAVCSAVIACARTDLIGIHILLIPLLAVLRRQLAVSRRLCLVGQFVEPVPFVLKALNQSIPLI